MESTSHFGLSCNNVKSVNWSVIVYLWEYTNMHHPQTFGISCVNYINMSSANMFVLPYSVDPTPISLIKMFHSWFIYFSAVGIEHLNDSFLTVDELIPDHFTLLTLL